MIPTRKHLLMGICTVVLASGSMLALAKKEDADFAAWRNKPEEPFGNGAATFETVKQALLKNYIDKGLTEDDLYRAAVEGMLSNIDPNMAMWNKLMTPTEYRELVGDMQGRIVGIGIEVGFNEANGYADVVGVIPGTPAEKAGIARGDQILRIDGQSFKGKQLRDLVYAIRGKDGSEVKLTVLHDDSVKVLKIKRQGLVWDSVSTQMINKDVAVLFIRNFTEATPDLLKKNLAELKNKGVKGLIIDLRGNQGGAFEKTIESIQHLIPKNKLIVKVNKRGAEKEDLVNKTDPVLTNVPLVVLINGHTKSGAEIMAGALKMSAGATTVGTHTYGKWSAQSVDELPNKYAIKYTTATFLSPDGQDLTGKGLHPDIVVEFPEDEAGKLQSQRNIEQRVQADVQLQTAINVLKLKS
ncbi:MAG TPA: S41 family peptidase [Oligoflexus sp.]|uniref:S41 family peptidase n=1 Tax=Oligoflexus sp. TaxID=1971216 RepID=UPI002D43019D|nr:S41 family peptidase [Oligoflexus sp.]HYX34752.1 S41 family peptidase [Oligoflexus sp.]